MSRHFAVMNGSRFYVFLCYLFVYCVSGFVSTSIILNEGGCFTPDQKMGVCMEVRKCPQLSNLMQQGRPLSTEIANYLKQSHCGFEGSQPKVCCAVDRNNELFLFEPSSSGGISANLLPDTNTCGLHQYSMLRGSGHASIKEFPWLVLLEYQKPKGHEFNCGGTLINSRYVLTSAHCVERIPESWKLVRVRLGEYNLATVTDCQNDTYHSGSEHCADAPLNIRVAEKIVHELYDPEDNSQSYDIALLRLSRDVTFTEFIRPICLPTSSEILSEYNTDGKMTVAGWGFLSETLSHSNVKLKSRIPLKSSSECSSIYSTINVNLHGQLCTEEQSRCTVDSGGPLMIHKSTPTGFNWYIAGVKSFGPSPCGNNNWPDVYTRVTNYVDWIARQLKP